MAHIDPPVYRRMEQDKGPRAPVAPLAASCRLAAVLGLTVLSTAAAASNDEADPWRRARVDTELAQDLAGWATRLSGRARGPEAALPVFTPMDDDALARTVCPEQATGCRGIVAAYDTDRRRIVYRASLDMRDPTDQSFIVHELVHWLQHAERGDALVDHCEDVLTAEREAYRVQNDYLIRFLQWQRMGAILRFTSCSDDAARASGAPTVRMDASTGPITASRQVPTPAAPMAAAPTDRTGADPSVGRR